MTQTEMLSPKEFSALLEKRGVVRTARWVRKKCRKGVIHPAPVSDGGRLLIPASEVDRVLTPVASTS
jgi:hypothetical protein